MGNMYGAEQNGKRILFRDKFFTHKPFLEEEAEQEQQQQQDNNWRRFAGRIWTKKVLLGINAVLLALILLVLITQLIYWMTPWSGL